MTIVSRGCRLQGSWLCSAHSRASGNPGFGLRAGSPLSRGRTEFWSGARLRCEPCSPRPPRTGRGNSINRLGGLYRTARATSQPPIDDVLAVVVELADDGGVGEALEAELGNQCFVRLAAEQALAFHVQIGRAIDD